MNARNRLLLRSIGFGGLTKLVGSLMVFVGLPIVSHALAPGDYAAFLASMGAASFTTLFLGAVVSLVVRSLANALASGSTAALRLAERDSLGLFILAVAAAVLLSLPIIVIGGTAHLSATLLAVGLSAVGGVLMWGDSYRVALRTDHYSSLWLLVGNLLLLTLLVLLSRFGLTAVILVNFGMPLLTQLAILLHLRRERRFSIQPHLDIVAFRRQLTDMVPLLINSLAEYGKVFGAGLILSIVASRVDYARFATILLLVARLSNPLSLITRPLMPAYIDAQHKGDERWLRKAGTLLALLAIAGAAVALLACLIIDPAWLRWLIPPNLGGLSRSELMLSGALLWGIGLTSLMAPVFIAGRRLNLFVAINAGLVVLGIAAGIAPRTIGQEPEMLTSMAIASAATAIILLVVGRSLFRVPLAGELR